MRIRTKLFGVIVLSTAVVVVGMLAFTRWSIERGFVDFVERRQGQYIEETIRSFESYYASAGTWELLATDGRQWVELVYGRNMRRGRERRSAQRDGAGRGDTRRARLAGEPGTWPPQRAMDRLREDGRRLTLPLRMMLLDSAGNIVRAQESLLADATRRPIKVGGTQVGFLAIARGPSLSDLGDIRFLERQRFAVAMIALSAVVFSAVLALILAGRLTSPIRRLQDVARKLASGDYEARSGLLRGDELGKLGADIDALASALASHERTRRQWVADISHELRTPIALMRAELEAVQDGIRQLDKRTVDALHGDVGRLSRLVDDLHEVALTDLGGMSFHFECVSLAQYVKADVAALQTSFDEAGLEISAHVDPGVATNVNGDPGRLSQLVRNVLGNALRYTHSPGKIEVRVLPADNDGNVSLIIEDSAPGVPDASLERLFDRLYRVDISRNRAAGGAGLGLAICANIANGHGGTITASHSPLGGIRITVVLPHAGPDAPLGGPSPR